MLNLGDITLINGANCPSVDVIIGGSPCQNLSIAGTREGLQGAESSLFLHQVRLIKEMRDHDIIINQHTGTDICPRYMIWENVPGAFSTHKGEDFHKVLTEIASITGENVFIPRPPNGKWSTAGEIVGDSFSIAWRVIDAQYWGVPQRRRRIALVADFGGQRAGEILFKPQSLSGDITQSRTQEERAAGSVETSTDSTICLQGNSIDRTEHSGCCGKGWRYGAAYTLNTTDRHAVLVPTGDEIHLCSTNVIYDARGNGDGYISPTLTGDHQNRITDYTSILLSHNPYAVRRLTPLECERLQGYPDAWTDIGEWIDNKGKIHKPSDSPRYKALGNSIALPAWEWLLQALSDTYETTPTMASLFDGIGGFTYLWETINGSGSVKWISEIEPFPLAVTQRRFN